MRSISATIARLAAALGSRAQLETESDAVLRIPALYSPVIRLPEPFNFGTGGDMQTSGMSHVETDFQVNGDTTLAILRPGLWRIMIDLRMVTVGANLTGATAAVRLRQIKNDATIVSDLVLQKISGTLNGQQGYNYSFMALIEKNLRYDFIHQITNGAAGATQVAASTIIAERLL